LVGLPDLQELNIYGNKVAEIVIPPVTPVLTKLEILNLGYNDLAHLPDELDKLTALRTLKLMNNFLEKIPMRVCDMDLRVIDVSSNPVIQPPIETCERGISSMKRYYHCLRVEEQSKLKALEELQRKVQRQTSGKRNQIQKRNYGAFMLSLGKGKPLQSSSRCFSEDQMAMSVASTMPDLTGTETRSVTSAQSASSMPMLYTSDLRSQSSSIPSSLPFVVGGLTRAKLRLDSLDQESEYTESIIDPMEDSFSSSVTVNDTLKVIFVGMAMAGKTSMIRRLIEGENAVVPTHEERTVGVDIYEWDPKKDKRFEHIDSRIEFQDQELKASCGDVDVKLSVWDFAGQHVYHATHELFFSSRALYVLVWDMGVGNRKTFSRKGSFGGSFGAFELGCDLSDDEEEDDDFAHEEETLRADIALEHDIDEKVQFWIDCIQSSAPGAAILPVASFDDFFKRQGGPEEAKRRCVMLKQRLLKHEERRLEGIKRRLQDFQDQNRANDPAAIRLRKLLGPYYRPKLILGTDDDNCVVRVSGAQYTGFEELTERIVNIATGRFKLESKYPIFYGHIGARIPRMRLEVRDTVRKMRKEFKVVEWGHFLNELKDDHGLTCIEDISDALHFLTNVGELSFFGGVMADRELTSSTDQNHGGDVNLTYSDDMARDDDDDEGGRDEDQATLSIDQTSITVENTDDGSLTTVENYMSGGLAQFVFLNPRWLVAAVACILRHNLEREIKEARRTFYGGRSVGSRANRFSESQLNCPVITADDACMLWKTKKVTKVAAKKAEESSIDLTVTPFEFLLQLLVRFGVFVPIDLDIDKANLGGQEFSHMLENDYSNGEGHFSFSESDNHKDSDESAPKARFFFLPSLLGSSEPADIWSYKTTDSWKTTLCYSVLFPDGVPPGLMERLTASVLSSIYAVASRKQVYCKDLNGNTVATFEGNMAVRELLCWRTAFLIKLVTIVETLDGAKRESVVEIFGHLAERESHLCVGSDHMGPGMRRLIVSGRGQVGDGGRKVWKGGFLLVCKSIRRVLDTYGGLEFSYQGFCPECLAKRPINEASYWNISTLRSAVKNSEPKIRCQHGHEVDTRLVAGPVDTPQKAEEMMTAPATDASVSVQTLLHSVVLVGLWDGKTQKIVRVGSGFVVDKKRGLIVTASHTLMNIWGDKNSPFGEDYYGLRQGKVVIGVIPREAGPDGYANENVAVFRYFAKIVAKDPAIDKGECHIDACVLKITTRLENDVGGNGQGCGSQPEKLLLNNPIAMKNERLQSLKVSARCELEEQVRILGFNQGGEGLLGPGESLSRYADFAKGYVCKKFASGEDSSGGAKLRDRFKPRSEIVIICPTIGGHSGGPCVNQQGEVIGILSRADPAENQRCYLSPTHEWKHLVKLAKKDM
jgi:hypothetical protein